MPKFEYVYNRRGEKYRVIHRDETQVIAAVQVVHQATNWHGDDYEEFEDDGPIHILNPSDCFPAPPVAVKKVSEELTALEDRLRKMRNEFGRLKAELVTAQKEHTEKMAALAERDKALERLEAYLDGAITHYVVLESYEARLIPADETLGKEEWSTRKRLGRLLTLSPKSMHSGPLVWQLNEYRDGSGSRTTVIPVESREEGLAHLQTWLNEKIQQVDKPRRNLVDFARKYNLQLPDGYAESLVELERAAMLKAEQKAQSDLDKTRRSNEAYWKMIGRKDDA